MSAEDLTRLDEVAAVVERSLGPEQSSDPREREILRSSRKMPETWPWVGDRPWLTHEEAHDFDLWVAWLIETYPIRSKIPKEWHTIAAVTAELWALWQMHMRAVELAADPRDLNDWHRSLEDAVQRIQIWTTEDRKAAQLKAGDRSDTR